MSAFVDTNIIVRHLTGEPPEMASRATAYLTAEPELFLADLIVAETIFVLESFYKTHRGQIATAMRSLVALRSVVTVDPALLLRALEVYELDRIDFADGLSGGLRGELRRQPHRLVRPIHRSGRHRRTHRTTRNLTDAHGSSVVILVARRGSLDRDQSSMSPPRPPAAPGPHLLSQRRRAIARYRCSIGWRSSGCVIT